MFTDVAATNGSGDKGEGTFDVFLTGIGEPQRLKALQTTGNLFQVLGAGPMLGRTFHRRRNVRRPPARRHPELRAVAQPVRGGPGASSGATVTLSGRTYTVVGVMPPSFFYPSHDIQLWMPVGYKPDVFTKARRPHWLARRRAGSSRACRSIARRPT